MSYNPLSPSIRVHFDYCTLFFSLHSRPCVDICVGEIEALHCRLLMACSCSWCFDSPDTSFAAFELPHRFTLACYAFMATLVLFPLCRQVLFLLLLLAPLPLLYLSLFLHPANALSPPLNPLLLLSLGFYCMFYGNFQTLDALCTSNAFNAFQVFHSTTALAPTWPLWICLPHPPTGPPVFVCPSCMLSANLDGPKRTWASYVHVPMTQSLWLHWQKKWGGKCESGFKCNNVDSKGD